MEKIQGKNELIQQLREKIMELEGFPMPQQDRRIPFGLGSLEASFPRGTFPTGVVHEFISTKATGIASTNGFIVGLLDTLMQKGGFCLWVSRQRTLFPPGLKHYGVDPHRFIFVDVDQERDVLWAVEQGLKCDALVAVIGELKEISFAESQRLQLAVEQSRVTAFLHRYQPRTENTLACSTRWKITPMSSNLEEGMPGVGFPTWKVELLKVRNGKPGIWQMEWRNGNFHHLPLRKASILEMKKQHYA